jgi:peroxiredoxin
MKKYFLISLIIIIASIAAQSSARGAVKSINKVKPGPDHQFTSEDNSCQSDSDLLNNPAPLFELRGLDGKMYALKDLKGKIVVLNFWFIACKPCVNEMPVLNTIKNSYDRKKVVFLALSLDSKDAVNSFLQNHQFNYIQLPGAAKVHQKYRLDAYPVSIVIDARGIVSFVQVGGPDVGKNLPIAIDAALKRL